MFSLRRTILKILRYQIWLLKQLYLSNHSNILKKKLIRLYLKTQLNLMLDKEYKIARQIIISICLKCCYYHELHIFYLLRSNLFTNIETSSLAIANVLAEFDDIVCNTSTHFKSTVFWFNPIVQIFK